MAESLKNEPEQLWGRLFQLAYMMLHDQHAAEDVAQETVARAIERAAQFRADGDVLAWTYAIALNLCRAKLGRDKRGPSFVPADSLETARDRHRGPATSAMMRDAYRRAAAALAGLPTGLREVFILHYVEDLPYDVVGLICGISEGAARLRAMRARNELKLELASTLAPEVRLRLESEPITPAV